MFLYASFCIFVSPNWILGIYCSNIIGTLYYEHLVVTVEKRFGFLDLWMLWVYDGCNFSLFVLKSEQMSHLVKIPGIIIAATPVRAKATKITIQCRTCRNIIPNIALRPGLEGYALPRKCTT